MSDEHTQPTPKQIRAAVEPLFAYDERLRAVEVDMAALKVLPAEFIRMEARIVTDREQMEERLTTAIQASKPNPWPAVSALVAAAGFLFIVAAAIYTR